MLDADYVCTSHGPILTKGVFLETAKSRYEEWSRPVIHTEKQIPIFYCSAYGNTGLLAEKISEGIHSALKNACVNIYDINENDIGELKMKMNDSDAFLLGSPTINKDAVPPVWAMIASIDAINCKGKPVSAFGSYGWSGEAVPGMIERLKALKMNVFEEGFRCRFIPSETELSDAYEFGARFARSL
jgi:flavorubredoxin